MCYVIMRDMAGAYRVLVERSERQREKERNQLEDRHVWEDSIKTELHEVGRGLGLV